MKKILMTFLLIIFLSLFLTSYPGVHGNASDGQTYVVKKGDTLWDISAEYLGDPMSWPKLWERNRFLTNPNYIYPGLKLTIEPPQPVEEEFLIYEAPKVEVEEKPEEVAKAVEEKPKPVKIFLTRKEVLAGGELVKGKPEKVGNIIETTDVRVVFSPGDRVYLDLEKDYESGAMLGIFRVEGPVRVPGFSGNAYKNRYIGKVRVEGKFSGRYVGTVVELLEEALRTDYLEEEIPEVPEIEPRYLDDGLKGELVTGSGGNTEFAEGDILYVKGGSKVGFAPGDVVNVYLPLKSLQKMTVSEIPKGVKEEGDFVYAAKAVVIRVNDFFSTIYVVDSPISFNTPALVVRGKV